MFFDPLYFLFLAPGMLLAMFASWRVKSTFRRYSQERTSRGYTGAQIAEAILRAEGIRGVTIERSRGMLSDHYDPRARALRLSDDVYSGRSVAAAGVAAHEVGHAIQHAESYRWLTMRSQLVPVVELTSKLAMPMFFIGLVLASAQVAFGWIVAQVGAVLFGGMVVFQLLTLPVEFDASRRALATISKHGLLNPSEIGGARSVLRAAALTYVAAALQSLMTLLYFLLRAGLIGGRRD